MTDVPGRWFARHSEALTLYRVTRAPRLWRALIDDLGDPPVFDVTGPDGAVYRYRRLDPDAYSELPYDPSAWSESVWAALGLAKEALFPGAADGVVPDGLDELVRVAGRTEPDLDAHGRLTTVLVHGLRAPVLDAFPVGAVEAILATYRAVGMAAARDVYAAFFGALVAREVARWA